MSNWDKTYNSAWDNSEVMTEYENKLKQAALKLSKVLTAQDAATKVKQIKTDIATTDKAVTDLSNKVKNLSDDDSLLENSEEKSDEKETNEISNTDVSRLVETATSISEAQLSLIDELTYLVSQAIEQNDYKMAYHIERTIDLIKFNEI